MRWLALVLGLLLAQPAQAASTIDSLPPITQSPGVFPLPDPGCTNTSRTNLWISQGTGTTADFKIDALRAGYIFQGPTAPTCPFKYQLWWNTGSTPPSLNLYSGSAWALIGSFDTTNSLWISNTGSGTFPTIASSATTDLCQGGTVPNGTVNISGNASITSFGTSCQVGTRKILIWQDNATVVAGPNMILTSHVATTVNPGDGWFVTYLGGGVWQQFFEQPSQKTAGYVSNVTADQLGTANPGLDISADTVHLGASPDDNATVLTNFGQSFNASLGGAGGMDSGPGTAPLNNFLAIYAIAGTAGVSTLGYTCDVSCPPIYPGSNMPTGYTKSALLVVWPTNGSGALDLGFWRGKRFQWGQESFFLVGGTVPQPNPVSVSLLGYVPVVATSVTGRMNLTVPAGATYAGGGFPFSLIRSTASVVGARSIAQGVVPNAIVSTTAATRIVAGFYDVILSEKQTIYYSTSSDIGPTLEINLAVNSYTIP